MLLNIQYSFFQNILAKKERISIFTFNYFSFMFFSDSSNLQLAESSTYDMAETSNFNSIA